MEAHEDESDDVLWSRVIDGDGEAFGVIFDRHRDRVFRHAWGLVRPAHVAEDVTAMVFYEAWPGGGGLTYGS